MILGSAIWIRNGSILKDIRLGDYLLQKVKTVILCIGVRHMDTTKIVGFFFFNILFILVVLDLCCWAEEHRLSARASVLVEH